VKFLLFTLKCKVIFLDFDGVIVTKQNYNEPDPGLLDKLHKIIKATDPYIVISSDWKKYNSTDKLRKLIQYDKIIGITPRLNTRWFDIEMFESGGTFVPRGTEIKTWMEQAFVPEKFVILDDFDHLEPFLDRLIQTDPNICLTDEQVKLAIRMLND